LACASLNPDIPIFFLYFWSLTPHTTPVTHSLDVSHLHVGFLPNTRYITIMKRLTDVLRIFPAMM
jgi:hypothetical protein